MIQAGLLASLTLAATQPAAGDDARSEDLARYYELVSNSLSWGCCCTPNSDVPRSYRRRLNASRPILVRRYGQDAVDALDADVIARCEQESGLYDPVARRSSDAEHERNEETGRARNQRRFVRWYERRLGVLEARLGVIR